MNRTRNKPAFVGIGAQKCASTWVYQVLSDHPEVQVSTPKELDFFSCFYDKGFAWYESYFSDLDNPSRLCGEISPSYFPDSDAPARAAAYNPGFKVILALRDPIERAYSNHLHDVPLRHLQGDDLSFERGLENNPMYLEQCRYATHLKRWLVHFPTEQVLVVLQEDVKEDSDREARRVYRFLGIDENHQSEFSNQKANESYLPKSRQREALYKRISRLLNQLGLAWLAGVIRRSSVFQKIKAGNRQDIREIVPPMKPETRQLLVDQLADEMRELAGFLGRSDLPWKSWKKIRQLKSSD